mgnify:CR=1 FL=1
MSTFEQSQRDPFITESGSKQLFDDYEICINSKTRHEKMLNVNHDTDHRFQLSWGFASNRLELLMLQYSVGASVESMLESAKLTFAEFERHYTMFPDEELKLKLWEANGYRYVMWLTGLAYLLGLKEYLPKIAQWISSNPDDGNDPLISLLFNRLGVEGLPTASELLHPKGYTPLYELLTQTQDKTKQQTLMQTYIRGFYKNIMNQTVWKGWDKEGWIYFGFWSFEAGMITHLLNLDDSGYRDMTFYPKDLVEYARTQQPASSPMPNRYTGRTLRVGETCTSTGWYEALLLNNRREHFTAGQVIEGQAISAHGQPIIWYELTPEATK